MTFTCDGCGETLLAAACEHHRCRAKRPKFGVVGVAEGKPDVWATANHQRWYADTMVRAQKEADERNEFAKRGAEVFVGRFWQPMQF